MNKYFYSTIRFVPSPMRGEFVNLGLIVGSDATGEWAIHVASSRSRARKIDDQDVFPMVATDLQRLQSDIESYSDPESFTPNIDLSLEWLSKLSRDSQNLLQFSSPKPILSLDANGALEQLWTLLVVEPEKHEQTKLTKSSVLSRYWYALKNKNLGQANLKKNASLETSKAHTSVDIVVHNGVAKDITQCWSLQVKNPDRVMEDIKAWGWTMKILRDHGGQVRAGEQSIEVPGDVKLGVVYAPSNDPGVIDAALEVFSDEDVDAASYTLEEANAYADLTAEIVKG